MDPLEYFFFAYALVGVWTFFTVHRLIVWADVSGWIDRYNTAARAFGAAGILAHSIEQVKKKETE